MILRKALRTLNSLLIWSRELTINMESTVDLSRQKETGATPKYSFLTQEPAWRDDMDSTRNELQL